MDTGGESSRTQPWGRLGGEDGDRGELLDDRRLGDGEGVRGMACTGEAVLREGCGQGRCQRNGVSESTWGPQCVCRGGR